MKSQAVSIVVMGAAVLAVLVLPVAVSGANLLPNGDFEADPDGTMRTGQDYVDTTTFTQWRAFAVGGAGSTFRVTSAAASSGSKGMEMAYDTAGADSALDKDAAAFRVPIAGNRVYQLKVDARDGGPYGGTPSFVVGFQMFNSGGYAGGRSYSFDPSSTFETIGQTVTASATIQALSVRFDMGGSTAGRSVQLDNARVYDVTHSNRVVNGGFENSASRALNWRFFAAGGATGSVSISSDAYEGAHAALLSRTNTTGDTGLDLWGGPGSPSVAVLGGQESIQVSFAAKKVSGDSNTRLGLQVATFDANGTFLGDAFGTRYNVGSGGYTVFSTGPLALASNVAYVSMGWRVVSDTGGPAIGSYLLDGAVIVPEPATLILLAGGLFVMGRIGRRHRRVG
ncbi:MAG: PEP-CTERM sorting domain-containing protein [Phycisphaerae bacterium]